jgi:hypothetical protein
VDVQSTGQIILYESDCSKSRKGASSFSGGTATIEVTGATTGATYIVGIKYSLSSLAGQTVTPPYPTVTYSFATNFGGGPIAGSQDSITITPKP